ncbi:tyrosine aminotransferase-like [Macrosteles quadrilineatus]|uniref:tyrosine aminotransferase-like n=1 Tax=Macrosteles quadrilineatus TaxID=74068 RepID=UPI0023E1F345|nr:tyrosine aminotransferase-like [Macrosteles quadrilineatus]
MVPARSGVEMSVPAKPWSVCASSVARNTHNPIRAIVEGLHIQPHPDKQLIALSIGDPTVFGNLVPPTEVIEAVEESLHSQRYNGYAPASGYQEAKQAVADYSSHSGLTVKPEDVVLCSGCSSAIDLCITVLANPGQTILVPCPGFSIYRTLAEGLGINVKTYKLMPDRNWEIDTQDLERQIDRDTVAIVVNNPSNPCGSVYTVQHLESVLRVAERQRVPIIADEIYEHLVFPGNKYHPLASLGSNVPILSCSGLTKRFLIPGWRMGWIIIHDGQHIFGEEIRRGLQNLSMRTIGSNTLVQGALPRILKHTPQQFFDKTIKTIHTHAMIAFKMLSEVPGIQPTMPQGAMYMMVGVNLCQFPLISSTLEFVEKLVSEESVFCLPGECFGYPGYIRLVLTVPQPQIIEACYRIQMFCTRHVNEKREIVLFHPSFSLLRQPTSA